MTNSSVKVIVYLPSSIAHLLCFEIKMKLKIHSFEDTRD